MLYLGDHLKNGWAVRTARPSDTTAIARTMRGADRAELEALEGRPADHALRGALSSNSRTLTLWSEPVAMWGIVPCVGLPGHSMPWVATTSALTAGALTDFMSMSRLQVRLWQRRTVVLRAIVDSRNHFRRDWLQWLGFVQCGHLSAFGAARLPFDLYLRH